MFVFKLNVFPFSFYVLDIYEALSFNKLFYLSAVLKPIIFFTFCKIYFLFGLLCISTWLLVVGLFSIFISGLLAVKYTKLKRFFGLTTVNLNGLLFVCLGSNSLDATIMAIAYLFFYNLSLFFIFFQLSSYFSKYCETVSLISEINFNKSTSK